MKTPRGVCRISKQPVQGLGLRVSSSVFCQTGHGESSSRMESDSSSCKTKPRIFDSTNSTTNATDKSDVLDRVPESDEERGSVNKSKRKRLRRKQNKQK